MMFERGNRKALRFCAGLLAAAHVSVAAPAGAQETSSACGPRCQMVKAIISAIMGQLDFVHGELQSLLPEIDGSTNEDSTPPYTSTIPDRPSNIPDYPSIYPSIPTGPEIPTTTFTTITVTPSSTSSYTEPTEPAMPPSDGFRSVAYFTNWGIYGRAYTPDKIPAEKLTHILYAFGDNKEDGSVFLTDTWADIEKHYESDSWNDVGSNIYGNLKQLNLLKRRNRNLKILLSIGGWTYTNTQKHLDTPASTPEGRKKFADTCVRLIKDLGLDGIDLDWEYPNAAQREQMLLLLQAVRKAMDAYADHLVTAHAQTERPHFLLTIASSAGKDNYNAYDFPGLADVLDFINLMAYDYSGAWDSNAGHQASLYASKSCPTCTPYDTVEVIEDYISRGIPSDKIVLGMPLYGRAFTNTDGIGKPYSGVGEGSWENGIWDYRVLPRPGAQEYYDEESGATYSYNNSTRTLISYDTPEMALRKAQFIQNNRLGGAMWWELSGDADGDKSLITTVVKQLGGPDGSGLEQQSNWLYYPDSQYANVKEGFPSN